MAPHQRRTRTTTRPRLAAAVLLALAATACAGPAGPAGSRGNDGATPRRIVVMAPAAAEMLDTLDAADRIVGVGDFVTSPASVAALPKVGAYDAPDVERVLALEADLLLTTDSRAADAAHRRLAALGVEVMALDTSTFEGVFDSLARVGAVVGRETRAAELERDVRMRLDVIARRAAELPRRRVLVVVGRDPLYVAAPGSHLDRLVTIAGGVNVAADATAPYQQFSIEAVLERRPEVIVDTSDNRPGAAVGRTTEGWNRWPFLPAVEQDRVWRVAPQRLAIPGLRLPEMAELLARMIHPEVFGEPAGRGLDAPADGAGDAGGAEGEVEAHGA